MGWLWRQRNCPNWLAICAIKRATTTSRWSPAWIGRSISRWCITFIGLVHSPQTRRGGDTETRRRISRVPCPRVRVPGGSCSEGSLPDKATPSLPSLISVWPGADLQEREVYDMMGIRFEGHPNLRRILLWDGFEGWPLRKDYKESYFEEDLKPFKTRHPDGQHQWAEIACRGKTTSPIPSPGTRPLHAADGAVPAHHGGRQGG